MNLEILPGTTAVLTWTRYLAISGLFSTFEIRHSIFDHSDWLHLLFQNYHQPIPTWLISRRLGHFLADFYILNMSKTACQLIIINLDGNWPTLADSST